MRIIKQHLHSLASPSRIRIERFQGLLRGTSNSISVVYAGNGSNAEYLTDLISQRVDSRSPLGECSPLSFERFFRRLAVAADLVVIERSPLWDALSARTGTLRTPAWVRQELRLEQKPDATASSRWTFGRHLDREVQRHIRRHDYRVVMSSDPNDRLVFFRDFYLPYIRSRHGLDAVTVNQDLFNATAASAVLAKLYAGDVWTAGMLLHYRNDELKFGWFGSSQNPPLTGASEVLDWCCIDAAAVRGIQRINFGGARPRLADGVLKYKRKFGVESLAPRYPQIMFEWQVRNDRADVRTWINEQQFLCVRSGQLAVASYPSSGATDVCYQILA